MLTIRVRRRLSWLEILGLSVFTAVLTVMTLATGAQAVELAKALGWLQ